MYYAQISPALYLVMQEILHIQAKPSKPQPTNHILIVDRSGSMSWTIDALLDNVFERVKSFKPGDSISLGYFSGEGEFRFPLKGFKVGGNADLADFFAVLNTLRSTLSTTCFSEILKDLGQVLDELAPLAGLSSLTLFTDGCPVVKDTRREEIAIFRAIIDAAPKLNQVLLVGYGGYYNKALMTRMAKAFGGSLAHAGDIGTFALQYEEFTKGSVDERQRVPVRPEMLCQPISLQGRQVNVHTVEKDEEGTFVQVAPVQKGRSWLYYLVDSTMRIDPLSKLLTFSKDNASLSTVAAVESLRKGAYGLALSLSQQTRTDDALEILGALGDVALIDAVNNAFTVEDYGQAEHKIGQAITFPSRRFVKGRDTNYLPKADAFCVLDALDLLMADEEACFFPRHPDFVYRRIGKATKTVEGYPRFEANEDARCAFTTLNWHKEFLNLSVLARIEGTVDLGEEASKFGFAQMYPTFVWRNYAIIKDGMLNTMKLPVECSTPSYSVLRAEGLFCEEGRSLMTLDLSKIPVMNRAMAEGKTSATGLCLLAKQELELTAFLKVLRWQKDRLEPVVERSVLSDVQLAFLETKGIGKNGFHPPVIQEPATDFYLAKTFSVSAKGFSSLPAVQKVLEKMGKKMTLAETLLGTALEFVGFPDSPVMNLAWLDREIAERTKALREIRKEIQRTKFSIILGKLWFPEFTSREDTSWPAGGLTFDFKVRDDVRVEI